MAMGSETERTVISEQDNADDNQSDETVDAGDVEEACVEK